MSNDKINLLKYTIQQRILHNSQPFHNPIGGMHDMSNSIAINVTDSIQECSDFMEWSNLKGTDLKKRIRNDLCMQYYYRYPSPNLSRKHAHFWANVTTKLILKCVGDEILHHSKLLE
tara:strand:+ start:876 stop:1226 length:351 start_codon:yes stop_codon:yes gene_type:complete